MQGVPLIEPFSILNLRRLGRMRHYHACCEKCRHHAAWRDFAEALAPWSIAEGTGLLNDDVGHPFDIHGIFEERGHTMARILDEVGVRMPNPDERQSLQLPAGVPVLDALHTSIDTDGDPYELTRFVMRADLSGLRYDAPVE